MERKFGPRTTPTTQPAEPEPSASPWQMPDGIRSYYGLGPVVQAKLSTPEAQAHAATGGGAAGAAGGGAPLESGVATRMESFFRADLSSVRVHEGPRATSMGALALTQGNDIHFAPGRYRPDSDAGRRLIGHEVAHVIQQREGRALPGQPKGGVSVNSDPALEAEADRLGDAAADGHAGPHDARCSHGGAGTSAVQLKVDAGKSAGYWVTRIADGVEGRILGSAPGGYFVDWQGTGADNVVYTYDELDDVQPAKKAKTSATPAAANNAQPAAANNAQANQAPGVPVGMAPGSSAPVKSPLRMGWEHDLTLRGENPADAKMASAMTKYENGGPEAIALANLLIGGQAWKSKVITSMFNSLSAGPYCAPAAQIVFQRFKFVSRSHEIYKEMCRRPAALAVCAAILDALPDIAADKLSALVGPTIQAVGSGLCNLQNVAEYHAKLDAAKGGVDDLTWLFALCARGLPQTQALVKAFLSSILYAPVADAREVMDLVVDCGNLDLAFEIASPLSFHKSVPLTTQLKLLKVCPAATRPLLEWMQKRHPAGGAQAENELQWLLAKTIDKHEIAKWVLEKAPAQKDAIFDYIWLGADATARHKRQVTIEAKGWNTNASDASLQLSYTPHETHLIANRTVSWKDNHVANDAQGAQAKAAQHNFPGASANGCITAGVAAMEQEIHKLMNHYRAVLDNVHAAGPNANSGLLRLAVTPGRKLWYAVKNSPDPPVEKDWLGLECAFLEDNGLKMTHAMPLSSAT